MGRPDLFRMLAIAALTGVFIATLFAINRRPGALVQPEVPSATSPDDLSAELRRCSALGPRDAEDARCVAVWEENRRRFLGRPARPLPLSTTPDSAAPATPSTGDAR